MDERPAHRPTSQFRHFHREKGKMTGSSELTQDPILGGCHATLTAVTDSMLPHKLLEQLHE